MAGTVSDSTTLPMPFVVQSEMFVRRSWNAAPPVTWCSAASILASSQATPCSYGGDADRLRLRRMATSTGPCRTG
ncbi:hypothetical protein ADL02_12805 [Streptomyces sp. NRRL WC-3723]|nr:hypothetical protein ADL02_12805 [Streptomyces sp. NRRL WC-3723]